ncbi:glycerol-3-phosphate dehydrogenase subunit GlpB [Halapricum hydrolyticum]|uniref:Glycerol-3-phosphate dehydrogenase subunit GlpB n=1 Tax=Halapricum hydrolyticum TaxID=2979991 RepID=A0AAE3IBE5_9EURY|nr:glycerol-3-phosphate dehydrogenase subunit GlpB [Halapricum hydrolyticum]MCU4718516.1 glycerol-3-phosphate dehydrogenase subunit GlpB [Halapricum hydrolyticum]MCU4727465.1 glycerol-3-phosphate dehydrogenase subunit GlpB [Halapricum hydrolyticum]
MAIESDVLVVGGGLAGVTSAIAAAREGADVRLLAHKKSTLRQASGLIDGLGYVPPRTPQQEHADYISQQRQDFRDVRGERGDYRGPLQTPYEGIDALPDAHPYSILGADALRDGLALFDDLVGDTYLGSHTERNALVPTFGGAVKPTARYPRAVAAGLASDERPMLLVGFRSLTEFDAGMVADQLSAAGVLFDVRGVEVPFAESFPTDTKITRFVKAFDHDERIEGTPARRALAEAVEAYVDDAERVGFPAVLGDDNAAAVRADLGDCLGADVFEIPMGPPSIPGLRLEDRLFEALDAEGVRLETGVPAVGYESAGGTVESVIVDRMGSDVPYAADAVVLATGGLVGKGLDSDRDGIREPVFGCHVPHPEDRYDWFVDDAFGDQPYARFGVRPDASMRPLDADGEPAFANLFAAGAVVGGADAAREKSASGVSLATGVVAGRNAAIASRERTERAGASP